MIRLRLRRKKALKLKVKNLVGKAFSGEEKTAMLAAAKTARAPSIYPALTLALNAGMRGARDGADEGEVRRGEESGEIFRAPGIPGSWGSLVIWPVLGRLTRLRYDKNPYDA